MGPLRLNLTWVLFPEITRKESLSSILGFSSLLHQQTLRDRLNAVISSCRAQKMWEGGVVTRPMLVLMMIALLVVAGCPVQDPPPPEVVYAGLCPGGGSDLWPLGRDA